MINGIPLKSGASATAAASPVRAVPVTKLMSLTSSLICLLAVVINLLRCWTVIAPNIIVGRMV